MFVSIVSEHHRVCGPGFLPGLLQSDFNERHSPNQMCLFDYLRNIISI